MEFFALLLVLVPPILFILTQPPRQHGMDPIWAFWAGYIYYGVAQPALNMGGLLGLYGPSTFWRACCMFFCGGLAVVVGNRTSFAKRLMSAFPKTRTVCSERRLFFVGALLIFVGLAATVYVVITSGGWTKYISAGRTSTDWTSISGYIYLLPLIVPGGLLAMLVSRWRPASNPIGRSIPTALTTLYTAWMLYTGTRAGLITVAVVVVGVKWAQIKRLPIGWCLSCGAVLVPLIGFVSIYRMKIYDLALHTRDSPLEIAQNVVLFYMVPEGHQYSIRATEFGMTLAAADLVPGQIDYDYGRMLLEPFTHMVPRSFWPNKVYPEGEAWDKFHEAAGSTTYRNAAGQLAGPSPGFATKYYYILGWAGGVFGVYWSGLFLRIIYEYSLKYNDTRRIVLQVGCFLLGFLESLHPFHWIIIWVPTWGLALGILLLVVGRRVPSRPRVYSIVRRAKV